MPRLVKGTIFEKPTARWWGRFTTAQGRRAIELVTCTTAHQAGRQPKADADGELAEPSLPSLRECEAQPALAARDLLSGEGSLED